MTVFIIKHLNDGHVEPSSARRQGVWKSRSTALQRIKKYWKPRDLYKRIYGDTRPWEVKFREEQARLAEFREANPFDQWWPKHFEILELK